jgi:chloramphenicol 3-O-phosphotransferase
MPPRAIPTPGARSAVGGYVENVGMNSLLAGYAHWSSEHLADCVDRLSGLRTLDGMGGTVLATVAEKKRG